MLKLPLLQRSENIISENQHINKDQSTEFQRKFNSIERIEERREPYQANNSELSDDEVVKKVLQGYHAAYFCCSILQLSPETLQHSSSELQSAITLLEQVFTNIHPSKIWHWKVFQMKKSYRSNISFSQ